MTKIVACHRPTDQLCAECTVNRCYICKANVNYEAQSVIIFLIGA
jgi:hypothetical protein